MPRKASGKRKSTSNGGTGVGGSSSSVGDDCLLGRPRMPKAKRKQHKPIPKRLSERQKTTVRRQNNRQAAQNLRDRKKQYEQGLEDRAKDLEGENARMESDIEQATAVSQELADKIRILAAIVDKLAATEEEGAATDTNPIAATSPSSQGQCEQLHGQEAAGINSPDLAASSPSDNTVPLNSTASSVDGAAVLPRSGTTTPSPNLTEMMELNLLSMSDSLTDMSDIGTGGTSDLKILPEISSTSTTNESTTDMPATTTTGLSRLWIDAETNHTATTTATRRAESEGGDVFFDSPLLMTQGEARALSPSPLLSPISQSLPPSSIISSASMMSDSTATTTRNRNTNTTTTADTTASAAMKKCESSSSLAAATMGGAPIVPEMSQMQPMDLPETEALFDSAAIKPNPLPSELRFCKALCCFLGITTFLSPPGSSQNYSQTVSEVKEGVGKEKEEEEEEEEEKMVVPEKMPPSVMNASSPIPNTAKSDRYPHTATSSRPYRNPLTARDPLWPPGRDQLPLEALAANVDQPLVQSLMAHLGRTAAVAAAANAAAHGLGVGSQGQHPNTHSSIAAYQQQLEVTLA